MKRILAPLCFAGTLFAQQQTVIVTGVNGVVAAPETLMDVNKATTTIADAGKLIRDTLGAASLDGGGAVILHLVRWKDDGSLDKQNWYLYHDGVNSQEEFTGLRIYGLHKISLLHVQLNAKAAAANDVRRYGAINSEFESLFRQFGLEDAGSGEKTELLRCLANDRSLLSGTAGGLADRCPALSKGELPRNDAGLETAKDAYIAANAERIAGRMQLAPSPSAGQDCGVPVLNEPSTLVGQYCVQSRFTNATYQVVATPKLPAAVSDLLRLIQPQAGERLDRQLRVQSVAVWGGEQMRIAPVPSDIKVTPILADNELAPAVFDNEGRYYWDISAGIPLKSIRETEYGDAAQGFGPKTVERQSLYAMINVFPIKLDTKSTGDWRLTPAVVAGVGITGRPLDRLVFGGALGIGRIQFFVGTALSRKRFPGQDGAPGDPVYRTNLVYGLNVPVRQVLNKLKAAK